MRQFMATAAVVAGTMAMATGASAALLDFTSSPSILSPAFGPGNGPYTSALAGGFTVTANPDDLTFNGGEGPGPLDGLAGDGDGLGIVDDEVSENPTVGETLLVEFDTTVTLNSLRFLDLFENPNAADSERAFLEVDGGAPIEFVAVEPFPNDFGYARFDGLGLTGKSFLFYAGVGNDGRGLGDFALAAMDVDSVIPLPASVFLLGGALGGLGLMRRRRK